MPSKESTSNHLPHQKRQAPKPPVIVEETHKNVIEPTNSTDDITKTETVTTEEKPKDIEPAKVEEVVESKPEKSEPLVDDMKQIEAMDTSEEKPSSDNQNESQIEETKSSEERMSPNYEVVVSPNHSTIIKTLEDSNPDMSHVSIVTIDNNGTDVLIQTTNDGSSSESEHISQTPPPPHFPSSPTKDEVVIIRNEDFSTSDKIVVTTEYMPSSDENTFQNDTKVFAKDDQNTSNASPVTEADDTISIHTSSSDNSANQSEFKPKIKVNLNLVSESEPQSSSKVLSKDKIETSEVSKSRVDQIPNPKTSKTKAVAAATNGMYTPEAANKSNNAAVLKRELSDSGSFFSVSSDKENNNETETSHQNQNPVVLRKRREKV